MCKLSQRDNLSLQLQNFAIVLKGLFGNDTVSRFYSRPSRKGLREELRSDELDVFLNSKATKEEIRTAGIKLSAAHYTKNKKTYFERNVPQDPLRK